MKKKVNAVLKKAAYLMLVMALVITAMPLQISATAAPEMTEEEDTISERWGIGGGSSANPEQQPNEDESNAVLGEITLEAARYCYDGNREQKSQSGKTVGAVAAFSYAFSTAAASTQDNVWNGYYAELTITAKEVDEDGNVVKDGETFTTSEKLNFDSASKENACISVACDVYKNAKATATLEIKNDKGVVVKKVESGYENLSKTSEECSVTMPVQATADFSEIIGSFETPTRQNPKTGGEDSNYYAAVTSTMKITITADKSYTKEEQLQAIKGRVQNYLQGKQLVIRETEEIAAHDIQLPEDIQFVSVLDEEKKETGKYTCEISCKDWLTISSHGEHNYTLAVVAENEKEDIITRCNNTDTPDVKVDPIEQKFTYTRVDKTTGKVLGENAVNPVFGETIRYSLDKTTAENLYGDFACYEVDENEAIVADSELQIDTGAAGEIYITCNELGTHKVKIEYSKKNACDANCQIITFEVEKAPLEGDVYVSSKLATDENAQFELIEDKEPIEKWKTIEVTTTLGEIKGSALKCKENEYYKNLTISYYAIPQSNVYEKMYLGTIGIGKTNIDSLTDYIDEVNIIYSKENNTVKYISTIKEEGVEELQKTETYEIQAVLTFDENNPYYLTKDSTATNTITTDGTYSVQNEDLLITDDIATENISLDWNASTTFSYDVKGMQSNQSVEANRVNVSINNSTTSTGEVSCTSNNDRTITIKGLKAGETTLQINASEKIPEGSIRNRYNAAAPHTITIRVNTPPASYTINGMTQEAFLESIRIGENEHWSKTPVTIELDTSTGAYEQIEYRELGSDVWNTTDGAEWTIGESDLTNYEFRFISKENNLYSDEYIQEDGTLRGTEKIMHLGVDMTDPVIPADLYTSLAPTGNSDDSISYFAKKITVNAADIRDYGAENAGVRSEGSGIKAIYVKYGNDSQWMELDGNSVSRYGSFTYVLKLAEDKNYGTIQMKVTDYVGNESEPVTYKGAYKAATAAANKQSATQAAAGDTTPVGEKARAICVDTKAPEIQVAAYVYNIEEKDFISYDGNWVNQQLKYQVSLAETSVSGVAGYEYLFVPQGESFETMTNSWETLTVENTGNEAIASKTYGSIKKENDQQTKKGSFILPGDKAEDNEDKTTQSNPDGQRNGTIYFRATSKAGLTTANKDIKAASEKANPVDKKNNKKNPNKNGNVRIWQQTLGEPAVKINEKPDTKTGWYNGAGKKAKITFAYPEYNSSQYAPAVGICYELKQTTLNDKKEETTETITKTFYKGIMDETTGEVVEVTDYADLETEASLKNDGAIKINKDSINELTVYTIDLAGNISNKYTYTVKADYTAPTDISVLFNGEKNGKSLHKITDKNIIYRLFSKENIEVTADADFGISGKSKLGLMLCKETEDAKDLSKLVNKSSMTIEPNNRGFVFLYAKDKAGNITRVRTDGFVSDKENPVGQDSEVIDIIAYGANDNGFFNKDIDITVKAKDAPDNDNFAGLKQITYSVGTADGETLTDKRIDNIEEGELDWQKIEKSASFSKDDILISAKDNESNEAYIRVTAMDKAGNEVTEEKELMIDITLPEITVTYDKNQENSRYYSTDRVAKVEIIEKNFDPEGVKILVTRDGNPYDAAIDGWKMEEEVNTAYLTFHEDGDYTVTVECTDLADNAAEYTQVDEFTIDQTAPVVEVTYDNMTPWKENYYNTARTATITVEEHNFDEKLFQTEIAPTAGISRWSHSEDIHTATIVFAEDGQYTFNLNCTDLAGNEMEPFTQEEFCIDTIAPEITISGVADGSANAGDILPVVTMTDEHYDIEGTEITLTNSKGAQIELETVPAGAGNNYSYTLNNVNSQPDEIYTLTAKKTDLAGNETEVSYRFSLNRNGSTYDLSRMSDIVEKVYTKYLDMEDLSVLEMNVDKIEEFSIYVTRNGELLTNSKEGALPAAMEEDTIYYDTEITGNDETGYQYEYTLYRENFEQEGIYDIIFYSKDRAGNEANSTLTDKGAEITFIVDNTAPTVIINGVESGEFYAEDSKLVNVAVTDNFKLQNASFTLIDEDGKTVETYDYMELAKEDGEVVSISLPNSSKKLSLVYSAADMAGNDRQVLADSEEIPKGFMISTNAWLKFINNEVAVAVTAGTAAVIIAGVGTVGYFRKRKRVVKAK